MKTMYSIFLVFLAGVAIAQSSFTGVVESYRQEGEIIIIDGAEYRITGDTKVVVNGRLVGRSAIHVGQSIRYTPDFGNTGERFIKQIELQLADEHAEHLFNH